MIDRPEPLRRLDGYFGAARIAHEYVSDIHRELVELNADDAHTRELLRDSAAVVLERMPTLTRQVRTLRRQWSEQELLDPTAADRTIERLNHELASVMPAILAARAQQDRIAVELLDLLHQVR